MHTSLRPEVVALVVHDLKNALGQLEAQLDGLRRAPGRERAARAHRQCADMRQRFLNFLTLYREDGVLTAHCDDESPQAFLDGLVGRGVPGESTVQLRVGGCAHAPAFWYFDFRLVRMAMDAALHNAFRFARSQVVLDARREGGWLVLSVTDDGPGLAATDPAAPTSSGLGTELCRAVARAHDAPGRAGRVELFDVAEGGARFEIWLP